MSWLRFFLIFIFLIGGRRNGIDFRPFCFYFAVVLGRSLRSKIAHLIFMDVNSGAVYFAPMDLRVLQSHDLPIASILSSLGCVERVLFGDSSLLEGLRCDCKW